MYTIDISAMNSFARIKGVYQINHKQVRLQGDRNNMYCKQLLLITITIIIIIIIIFTTIIHHAYFFILIHVNVEKIKKNVF